jgi:hypothetical protein
MLGEKLSCKRRLNHRKWNIPLQIKRGNPKRGISQQPTKFLKKKIGYKATRRSRDCTIVEKLSVGVVKQWGKYNESWLIRTPR